MLLHNLKNYSFGGFPVNRWEKKFLLIRYVGNSPFITKNTAHKALRKSQLVMRQTVPKTSMPWKPQRNEQSHSPICEKNGWRAEAMANHILYEFASSQGILT